MNTLQNSANTVPCCIIEVKAEQNRNYDFMIWDFIQAVL